MADASGLEGGGEDDSAANVAAYLPIEKMYKVHDKLHLLNYEVDFIKMTKLPRFHRLYFAYPTNPGEQYYNFVTLSAWLINKSKRKMDVPQEYDDPNEVISRILEHVKAMGGVVDVSASKLKPGFGPDVITVLDFLTDQALQGYVFEPVVIPDEATVPAEDNEDKEINMAQIEEEMALLYEDDWNEEDGLQQQQQAPASALSKGGPSSLTHEKADEMRPIESNVSIEDWRLELERVLPQLSQPINIEDNYTWRTRTLQMTACMEEIKDVLSSLQKPLHRLKSEVSDSLEKVHGRESNLNTHLEAIMSEYATSNKRLQDLREKQRKITAEVNEKNKILAKLSEDVDSARRKLDERGNIMADGAPVAQARKDLTALKKEISDMDVEIGVMEHCWLKSMVQEQMSLFEDRK